MIDFRELIKAGSHFGHQTSRWCPKMKPYIYGLKNKVHLIDVSKTAFQLEKAAQFIEKLSAENKPVLWVGTKKAAQKVVQDVANGLKLPYVNHRWIGGTLSNYGQVKKSVTKLLHYEDVLEKAEKEAYYTKKELNTYQKLVGRLQKSVGGIRNLVWPIGALILVDVGKEQSALNEASMMGIPVIGVVDTNCDPSLVDFVIPANDDAPRSIQVILDYLAAAVVKGRDAAKKTAELKKAPKDKVITSATAPADKSAAKKVVAEVKTASVKSDVDQKVVEPSKAEAE